MKTIRLLVALAAVLIGAAQRSSAATSFTLTTTQGSAFTLWLNADVEADLSWSDGTTAKLPAGSVYTTTAPADKITVKVAAGKITEIVAPSSGITAVSLSSCTDLQVLWLPDNRLAALDLSRQKQLRNLVVSGNELEKLTLGSNQLSHLWVDANKLSGTLDLSELPALATVAADNNDYALIKLNGSATAKKALTDFYAHNNALWYNSFPTVYNTTTNKYTLRNVLAPQRPFFAFYGKELNQKYDSGDIFRYNAWNVAVSEELTFADTQGGELVSGTDFTKSGYNYTFLTEHKSVVITGTSRLYPDVVLTTQPFALLADLTGIAAPDLAAPAGQSTAAPAYDLSGRTLLQSGPSGRSLNHGLYIQNGKKIIR